MGCPSRIALAFTTTATLAVCASRTVHAQQGSEPTIAWLAVTKSTEANDCPNASELAQRVAQIAGQPVLALSPTSTTRLSFSVELTKSTAGYEATLRAKGSRSGVRNIADIGDNCSGLTDALAVTLAIIIDDERSTPPPAPSPIDSFPTAPSIQPTAPARTPKPKPEPEARAYHEYWRPYAGAVASMGLLGESAVGAAAGLDIQLDHLVMGASGLWLPPHRFAHAPGNATVSLVALGFHACFQPEIAPARTRLGLCAHFTEGLLRGEADGFSVNRSVSRRWTAPGVGAIVGGEVSAPLEWFVRTQLFVPLRRERFVIDNVGTVHETPVLGGLVGVGLALRIE